MGAEGRSGRQASRAGLPSTSTLSGPGCVSLQVTREELVAGGGLGGARASLQSTRSWDAGPGQPWGHSCRLWWRWGTGVTAGWSWNTPGREGAREGEAWPLAFREGSKAGPGPG